MKDAKEISVLFAQWVVDNLFKCPYNNTFIWHYNNGDIVAKNTEDLFDIFMKQLQLMLTLKTKL